MTISVFSVVMSIVCSSMILFSAGYLVSHAKRVRWELILLILLLGFARLILPVEIRSAREIATRTIYPYVQQAASQETFLGMTVARMLMILWAAGMGFLLLRFLGKRLALRGIIRYAKPVEDDELIRTVAERAKKRLGFDKEVRIALTEEFSTAVSAGFSKPIILLPKEMLNYPEMELQGILTHELIHYLRGDMGKQWALNFVQCIFWWNPVVYYLKRCVVEMLELECDERACRDMDEEEKLAYLEAIQRVLTSDRRREFDLGLGYGKNHSAEFLKRRFHEVLEPVRRHSNRATYLLAAASIALFCFSYSFILQPKIEPTAVIEDGKGTLLDGSESEEQEDFLVKLPGGTYLYVSGMVSKGILKEEDIIKPPYLGLPIYDSTKGD